MKKITLVVTLFSLLLGANALANATVYVIHGIPGQSVGIENAPVDVYVNGGLVLSNFLFRDIAGPLSLPAGTYDIAVYLHGANPAASDPVMTLSAPLTDGQNVSIIAHLTASGGFTLTPFGNNVKSISRSTFSRFIYNDDDLSRLAVRHTAQAPEVDLLVNDYPSLTLTNGAGAGAELFARKYNFALAPSGSLTPVYGPLTLELMDDYAYFVYAVGSLADGTFELILQPLPLTN